MDPGTHAELIITSSDRLGKEQLRRCAGLVFEAGRGYYDLLDIDRDAVEVRIADQIGLEGTELERTFVGLAGTEVAGMYACLSTNALPAAMMNGTVRLLSGLEIGDRLAFLERLAQIRPSLPTLPENSLYLARVAVGDNHKGSAVGKALMESFFSRLNEEESFSLHVLTRNVRAVSFFRRFGFEPCAEEKAGYLAMMRSAD